jgi:ABC-type thiamine transport system substrate-binding protein
MNVTPFARRAARKLAPVAVSLPLLAAGACAALAQGEVNIYSYREPQLIDPLLKAFTDKTGIKANVVFASAGLNERLAAEGANSPADLLLTVDAGRLSEAKDAGLTQPVDSAALKSAIPAPYRDPADNWFALTMRSRVVYASKERVKQDAITYEELADPKWKGKICIRHHDRQQGRGVHRDVAQGRQGQPGAQARRRRPRAGARHLLRQVRHRARQYLLHGADGQER